MLETHAATLDTADTTKPPEQEGKKYESFGDIIRAEKNPVIDKFLESSRKTYEQHNFSFWEIEIAEDRSAARFEFEVTKDMQANEGICHGGITAYIVDSVAGALALVRTEQGYKPLTTDFTMKYLLPCEVGRKYTIEVDLKETRRAQDKFTFLIRDSETGNVTLTGIIDYFKKREELE